MKKRKQRPTLLELGRRGSARHIRVYVDRGRQLVTAVRGGRKKDSWPDTDEGRAEAVAFAQAYHHESAKPAAQPPEPVGNRELFQRYAAANFGDLRPKTRVGHRNRWRLWEAFIGHGTPAGGVTLEHLDQFKVELLRRSFSPNQVRHIFTLVKAVYRWGQSRRLDVALDVAPYRLRMARDLRGHKPAEYRLEQFEALLPKIGSPQDVRTWRAWVLLMLLGHQGVRANAGRHLQLADIGEGRLRWRPEYDKRGKDWSQPIRDGALSAILTALDWRERDGYTGPWLIYPRPRAALRGGRADRQGRAWEAEHGPYTYAAFYAHLQAAELKAKVPHAAYRAAHGFRKMVAGEVLRETGNPKAALDFIGDDDLELIRDYLKVREDEKDRVAEILDRRPKVEA